MEQLSSVTIPQHYNYIGIFLTLGCNLSCSYCINHLSGLEKKRALLNGDQWSSIINRLNIHSDLPITIQGGEPSIHPHFFKIIEQVHPRIKIDLLTNLQFDVFKFADRINPNRFNRDSPYAPIRISYHPETMELKPLLEKTKYLQDKGFSLGVYSVDIKEHEQSLEEAKKLFLKHGISFKLKSLLGKFENTIHGEMRYKDAVGSSILKTCECKTSELLISPEGKVFRCHHDLYNRKFATGDLTSPNFTISDEYKPCHFYGNCNPCDIKIKNNRFQQHGHTSVTIKNIQQRSPNISI